MGENVVRFFEIYDRDEALRQRLQEAEYSYPGSLEIRDAVCEAILLPAAAELGLPFTLQELRAYETRKKLNTLSEPETDKVPEEKVFWLLEHGWEEDESRFKQDRG